MIMAQKQKEELAGCSGEVYDPDIGRYRRCPKLSACRRHEVYRKRSCRIIVAPAYVFDEHACENLT
jgi:hypothetical protein